MEPGNLNHRRKSMEGHLHLGRGSGLQVSKAKVLENLLDHLLILDEGDDLHPPLALWAGQGIHLPRSSRGQAPIF